MVGLSEYTEHSMNDKGVQIKKELNDMSNRMYGYACWNEKMNTGKSTPYLIYILNSYFKDVLKEPFKNYMEVGVLYGGSLCSLKLGGFEGKMYGLDLFQGYYGNYNNESVFDKKPHEKSIDGHKKLVLDNIDMMDGSDVSVELIDGNTQKEGARDKYNKKSIPNKIDVLLIDGDHTKQGALCDYKVLSPLVRDGGIILFDNWEMGGVKDAVEEILKEFPGKLEKSGVFRDTTWIGINRV
tara:strand:+ start:374 stop:1090 length:717 start_codon:yes stop_codon:yes gene_type:complete